MQAAVAPEFALALPDAEYYAFKFRLNNSRSTSSGSCSGCPTAMCIVLNEIQLFQPLGTAGGDPKISAPGSSGGSVVWQATGIPGCPQSTPTRNSSWGQVKSLYR